MSAPNPDLRFHRIPSISRFSWPAPRGLEESDNCRVAITYVSIDLRSLWHVAKDRRNGLRRLRPLREMVDIVSACEPVELRLSLEGFPSQVERTASHNREQFQSFSCVSEDRPAIQAEHRPISHGMLTRMQSGKMCPVCSEEWEDWEVTRGLDVQQTIFKG